MIPCISFFYSSDIFHCKYFHNISVEKQNPGCRLRMYGFCQRFHFIQKTQGSRLRMYGFCQKHLIKKSTNVLKNIFLMFKKKIRVGCRLRMYGFYLALMIYRQREGVCSGREGATECVLL